MRGFLRFGAGRVVPWGILPGGCGAFVGLCLGLVATVPALAAPLTVALPAPLPQVRLLTPMIGIHLVGLCLGFGAAAMMDFWLLRWMRWGGMPPEIERMIRFMAKVVTVGLALLWLSGLGFLAIYAVESPEKLFNPKMWAKVSVVIVLTLNGVVIHHWVLPRVLTDVRRPILEGLSPVSARAFLFSGAVSAVSWSFAFALGILREFNGVVPVQLLLGLWLGGGGGGEPRDRDPVGALATGRSPGPRPVPAAARDGGAALRGRAPPALGSRRHRGGRPRRDAAGAGSRGGGLRRRGRAVTASAADRPARRGCAPCTRRGPTGWRCGRGDGRSPSWRAPVRAG
ncbi:hypothetical protein M446_1608 [Methylobacterium sp. 4-46]|uniref:hypothetical protein n=1 Tax=unclassified Methylobacterium TaxID=2615210 RepID=UPI000152DF62|nr:hypothetical protein M446_1608 [Methylobacterium sp. 4-46]